MRFPIYYFAAELNKTHTQNILFAKAVYTTYHIVLLSCQRLVLHREKKETNRPLFYPCDTTHRYDVLATRDAIAAVDAESALTGATDAGVASGDGTAGITTTKVAGVARETGSGDDTGVTGDVNDEIDNGDISPDGDIGSSSFISHIFSRTRTNLPLIRGRSSASFFRQSYLMLFFHVRFLRFSWNFWMRNFLAAGLYEPIFFVFSLPKSSCSLLGAVMFSTPRNGSDDTPVNVGFEGAARACSSCNSSGLSALALTLSFSDGLMDPFEATLERLAVVAAPFACSFLANKLVRFFLLELLVGDGIVKFIVSKLIKSFSASFVCRPGSSMFIHSGVERRREREGTQTRSETVCRSSTTNQSGAH